MVAAHAEQVVEQVEFSLPAFIMELIEELKVYQNYQGRVTSENQVICFNNVAQVSFRISPEKLPAPVRKLYEDAKQAPKEDANLVVLTQVLRRLVK